MEKNSTGKEVREGQTEVQFDLGRPGKEGLSGQGTKEGKGKAMLILGQEK